MKPNRDGRMKHTTIDHRNQTEKDWPHADQKVGWYCVVYMYEAPNFLEDIKSMTLDDVCCEIQLERIVSMELVSMELTKCDNHEREQDTNERINQDRTAFL